jgi:hypothetical protein
MARLCANAEIGVPREDLHASGIIPARSAIPALPVITVLPAIPAPSPVIPAFPRHSCEGRNLNQGMDAMNYISP